MPFPIRHSALFLIQLLCTTSSLTPNNKEEGGLSKSKASGVCQNEGTRKKARDKKWDWGCFRTWKEKRRTGGNLPGQFSKKNWPDDVFFKGETWETLNSGISFPALQFTQPFFGWHFWSGWRRGSLEKSSYSLPSLLFSFVCLAIRTRVISPNFSSFLSFHCVLFTSFLGPVC